MSNSSSSSRRSRLKVCALCPESFIPVWTVVVGVILSVVLITVGYKLHPTYKGVGLEMWGLWVLSIWSSLLALNYIFVALNLLLNSSLFTSYMAYYTQQTTPWASLLTFSIIQFILLAYIFPGLDSTPRKIITETLDLILAISAMMCAKEVLNRVVLIRVLRGTLWTRLYDYLKKEKILRILFSDEETRSKLEQDYLFQQISLATKIPRPNLEEFLEQLEKTQQKELFTYTYAASKGIGKDRLIDNEDFHLKPPKEEIKQIAQNLFQSLDLNRDGVVTFEEFDEIFQNKGGSRNAFDLFCLTGEDIITLQDCYNMLDNVFTERENLYLILNDRTDHVVIIRQMFNLAAWFIAGIIVLGSLFGHNAVYSSMGVLLGLSFIFGRSLQTIWHGILINFFMRPFEIGDKIVIDSASLNPNVLIVTKLNMLTTEAYTPDGRQFILNNSSLFEMREILQYKRSRQYAIKYEIQTVCDTPPQKLEEAASLLKEWLEKEHPQIYRYEDLHYRVTEVQDLHRMSVYYRVPLRKINWQQARVAKRYRGLLIHQTALVYRQLGISFHLQPQPVILKKKDFFDILPSTDHEGKKEK